MIPKLAARMIVVLAATLLLSACVARDNRPSIEALERAAVLAPEAELDDRIRQAPPYLPVGPPRRLRLPMLPGDVPIVQGRINGIAMPLLLDTGTSHVVMSGPAASATGLYLPKGNTISLVTPGYDARFRSGAPRTISLGDMQFSGGIAIVPERENRHMRRLGLRSERHAAVGSSVLSNFRVTFDFGRREVILEPSGAPPFTGVLWTKVAIDGEDCLMLLDSGANGIFIEPSFARKLGLIDAKEAQRHSRKAATVGSAPLSLVHLGRLEIQGRAFRGLSAQVINLVDGSVSGGLPHAGLLGFAALGPHRWQVDCPNKLTLLSAPAPTTLTTDH